MGCATGWPHGRATVLDTVTGAWPTIPDGIADRDADMWEPLLAVADAAGGRWPGRARVTAVTLVTLSKAGTPSLGIRLLGDLRAVFGDHADAMSTDDILTALHKLDEAPWNEIGKPPKPIDARGLAQRLRQYEIRSTTVRIGEWHDKGYKREDLWDAWSRYLPPPEDDDDDLEPPAQGSVTTVTTDGRPCGICGNGFHPDPPSRSVCDRCRPQLAGTTT